MKNVNGIIKSAIKGALTLTAAGTLVMTTNAIAAQDLEKCYGVVIAGKNDCKTATHSCAGTATKDRQDDAFVLVPKGLCEKLAGGSTTMKTDSTDKK